MIDYVTAFGSSEVKLIVLPEYAINAHWQRIDLEDWMRISTTIPGPYTDLLADKAKQRGIWIAANMLGVDPVPPRRFSPRNRSSACRRDRILDCLTEGKNARKDLCQRREQRPRRRRRRRHYRRREEPEVPRHLLPRGQRTRRRGCIARLEPPRLARFLPPMRGPRPSRVAKQRIGTRTPSRSIDRSRSMNPSPALPAR